jgi:hypothetical protein
MLTQTPLMFWRLRQRQLTAKQEIGWSESSAASSEHAFSPCEP